jgi:CheY-like chemotaxis protein
LGLGLAICRTLVESHSGTIRATSQGRNQGSTFTITLPTVKKEAQEPGPQQHNGNGTGTAAKPTCSPLHILLVEDHEPTRKALAHLLARRHHKVKMAGTVAEARELFEKNNFQLLISDIGLPDGSGFELMKEFHTRNKNLHGIALTGYGMEQDVDRSEEAGFINHLTKPIRVQSLDLILATLSDN